MAFEIKITAIIKTFPQFSKSQIEKQVSDALWKVEAFRDVQMFPIEGLDLEGPKQPLNVIREVIDHFENK